MPFPPCRTRLTRRTWTHACAPRHQRGLGLIAGLVFLLGSLALALALALALTAVLAWDKLPSLDVITDYRPKVPLRVYTSDGVLIGEYGEERRSFVRIQDVPEVMKQAVLAAEDDRFFEHHGVDLLGILRAALANVVAGGKAQGASTITMQLARNFFLSNERSYSRKVYEILLSIRIEQALTKEQILEIYLNQIFLGQRAYGFASAAQIYFGKPLSQITAAEAAMLAGLPKAPSAYNPVVNPKRARIRQEYILGRMNSLGYLTDKQLEAALVEPLRLQPERGEFAVRAPYAAELARQLTIEQFREDAYVAGLNVYTTLRAADQRAATQALNRAVIGYDRRYGYRGPEARIELPADRARRDEKIEEALLEAGDIDDFHPAVITEVSPRHVTVSRSRGQKITIEGEGLKFVTSWLSGPQVATRKLTPGSVVRIAPGPKGWEITQLPEVQAAFVSASTDDGAIRSMVGGFDFNRNKFNRVTQAWRQPGSSFKPFVLSAALERGITPATLVNDAPIIVSAAVTGGQVWEPKNYDGKFEGPMSLRTGLARSKNMVSIRVIQAIGPQYTQDYITRFGFDAARHPPYLTMALGAGSVTPWQMVGAVSVFANGGYRVTPYLITRITDANGKVIAQAQPVRAGDEAHRVIDARNAFIMDSMLRDVVRKGTATAALRLKRSDLAGKTGTTNDAHDAWFAGYQPGLAGVAWVGHDRPRKLGDRETGGGLALPIWVDAMEVALRGVPESNPEPPAGVVQVNGEWYYTEFVPGKSVPSLGLTDEPPSLSGAADRTRSPN